MDMSLGNKVKRLEGIQKNKNREKVVFINSGDFKDSTDCDEYIARLTEEYKAQYINPIFFIDDVSI